MTKATSDNPNSQYGAGLIAKEVHDFYGKSIRTIDTRSVINKHFTHFRADYDAYSRPVSVSYYRGTKAHTTKFNAVATGLDGKYFSLRSAPDNALWAVWYNIDNLSVQPTVVGAKYIEININSGDSEQMVALATVLTLNTLYKDKFCASRNGLNVEISTVELGEVSDSFEGTTPFTFAQTSGTQELVQKVLITYDGRDPIYKGQTLKNYRYNIYAGVFEIKEFNPDEEWDEIQTSFPSVDTELFTYLKNNQTVQIVLVTYLDASKAQIISVQKTRY